jgi:hypothetical protein
MYKYNNKRQSMNKVRTSEKYAFSLMERYCRLVGANLSKYGLLPGPCQEIKKTVNGFRVVAFIGHHGEIELNVSKFWGNKTLVVGYIPSIRVWKKEVLVNG